jgi:hypothetical protein
VESWEKIAAGAIAKSMKVPILEAELIWTFGGRFNMGYSQKNPLGEIDGRPTLVIRPDIPAIIFWKLNWNYKLTIFNNCEVPAYNLKIAQSGNFKLGGFTPLRGVNNLPSLQSIEIPTNYETMLEGTYLQADEIWKQKIPKDLEWLQIEITYQDEDRKDHCTISKILNSQLVNEVVY